MIRQSLRPRALAIGSGILFAGLAGVWAASSTPNSESLAHVGGVEVKDSDVQAAIQGLTPEQQQTLLKKPEALNNVVKSLMLQRLVLKEALAKQWDKQPVIEAQLQKLRDSAIADSYLKSISQPPATFPDTALIQKVYDANQKSFLIPRQYHLAQIFVAGRKDADAQTLEQAKSKLEAIRKSLAQSGSDFGAVARIQSDDSASAQKGGEIGWVTDSQIQPELRSRVSTLGAKTTSEPIRLDDGWHILEVLEIKEPYTASLAEVRPLIVQRLRTEQARLNEQAYMSKLLQQNPIAVNEPEMTKLLKKSGEQ